MAHRMQRLGATSTNTGGVSVVEVALVVAIVALLSAVALTAVSGIRGRQRSSACEAELRKVRTAVEAYRAVPRGKPATAEPPASLDVLKFSGLLDPRAGQYVAYTRVRSHGHLVAQYRNGPKGDCVTN